MIIMEINLFSLSAPILFFLQNLSTFIIGTLNGFDGFKLKQERYSAIEKGPAIVKIIIMNCSQMMADCRLTCSIQIIKLEWPDISSWGQDFFRG